MTYQTNQKRHAMYHNQKQIDSLEQQIAELSERKEYLTAYGYLTWLSQNATFKNERLSKIYGRGENGHEIHIHFESERSTALKEVANAAKHFKEMDDSAAWPEWKKEAYKHAKVFDAWVAKEKHLI